MSDVSTISGISVEEFNSKVARNILAMREQRQLSQDDLEALSGVRKKTISLIENVGYKKFVDQAYIDDIAKALRIDSDAITESNKHVKFLIDYLNKEVYKVPVTKETKQLAEELVCLTENRCPYERSLAYMYFGLTAYYSEDYEAATELYEKAFAVARNANREDLLYRVMRNLASALMMVGMYGRAEEMMLSIIGNTKDEVTKVRDYYKLATLYYNKGDYDNSQKTYEFVLLCPSVTSQTSGLAKQVLGSIHRKKGLFEIAEKHVRESIEILELCGDLITLIYSYKTLGEIQRDKEEFYNSIESFQRGITLARETGREYEKLFLEFEITLMNNDYFSMKEIAFAFFDISGPINEITHVFEQTAEKAFDLQYYEDARCFYRKANEVLKKK